MILQQIAESGEKHTDALFEKIKLFAHRDEHSNNRLVILLREAEALVYHHQRNMLALIGHLIAAGCNRNQFFPAGRQKRSAKGIDHHAQGAVSSIFHLMHTGGKRTQRLY